MMKALISGSSGCVAFVEAETMEFLHVRKGSEWRQAPASDLARVFTYADDVVEVDVADREDAIRIAREKTEVANALAFLGVVMSSRDESNISLAGKRLDDLLRKAETRRAVQRYAFAVAWPREFSFDRTARVLSSMPQVYRLLHQLSELQAKIGDVGRRLDAALNGMTLSRAGREALRNDFVLSGHYASLVLGESELVTPDKRATLRYQRLKRDLTTDESRRRRRVHRWYPVLVSFVVSSSLAVAFAIGAIGLFVVSRSLGIEQIAQLAAIAAGLATIAAYLFIRMR